jgi:RNA polymerase sigma-70 factor, ECF subfamily
MTDSHTLTEWIKRWQDQGDMFARDQLLEAVYASVRAIAGRARAREARPELSTTELAHEALLDLLGRDSTFADRRHFFHVVAIAIRRLLTDQARERGRAKHGAGLTQISLSSALDQSAEPDFLRLNDAIADLEKQYPRSAQILEFSYFVGLQREQIAEALSISIPTVDRDLRFARAWLKDTLSS